MGKYGLDRLLGVPQQTTSFEPEEPENPFWNLQGQLEGTIAARIQQAEAERHRPLLAAERRQITNQAAEEFNQHIVSEWGGEQLSRFEADFTHQLSMLERTLGRRLLADELVGVREQAYRALTVRDEKLDIEKAHSDHWRTLGQQPPDMSSDHDVAAFMAQRVRDQAENDTRADELADTSSPTTSGIQWNTGKALNDHAENDARMAARTYELAGQPIPPHLQAYATQPVQDDDLESDAA